MNQLSQLIEQKEWMRISKQYTPKDLAENLSFVNGLILSRLLLENESFDDTIQIFAIELIKAIKELYKNEWESDWRYEAYLGYAYEFPGWYYEEQYDAYKRAFVKSGESDPEVLMRVAINWNCPGVYKQKLDEKQAIELLEKALIKKPYIEGISCLVNLYNDVGDMPQKKHWQAILEESEKKQLHAPYAFLDVFDTYGWKGPNG